jgi:hypothetical protein
MIQVKCPQCEKINRVSDEMAGKSTDCSICGLKLAVPAPVTDDTNETPHSDPQRGSNEDVYGGDEGDDRPDERKSKPKRKSKKRGSSESEPESDDVDRPRKRKSKSKSKSMLGDDLGPCKEVFTPNVGPLRIVAIVCGSLVVIGMLSCILTLIMSMPNGAILLAIIAIPGGLAGLLWCMNFLTLKVAVHAGGLVHSHRGQERTILWGNITSLTQEITEVNKNGDHVGTTSVYTLVLADYENIVYTSKLINNVDRLATIIVEKTSEILLPPIRIKYQNGEMASFGRLGVSLKGLHYVKHVLDWRDIERVRIHEGYFTVSRGGKWLRWCKIEASSVPNLGVFLMFVNEILDAR